MEVLETVGIEFQLDRAGAQSQREKCRDMWHGRLRGYELPDIGSGLVKDMWNYVQRRYGQISWLTPESSLKFETPALNF